MKALVISVFLLLCVSGQAVQLERRTKLDSMHRAIKSQMEEIDSRVERMDRYLDSIAGKKPPNIDTLALYLNLIEQQEQLQREKALLWVKGGAVVVFLIIAGAFWRWKRRKRLNAAK